MTISLLPRHLFIISAGIVVLALCAAAYFYLGTPDPSPYPSDSTISVIAGHTRPLPQNAPTAPLLPATVSANAADGASEGFNPAIEQRLIEMTQDDEPRRQREMIERQRAHAAFVAHQQSAPGNSDTSDANF